MRPTLVLAICLAAIPALAQDNDSVFQCDQKGLATELEGLCAGFAESYRHAMARPVEITGTGRPALKPRPEAFSHEIVGRGLGTQTIDHAKSPFVAPADRSLGLRVKAHDMPLQIYTEMVQPGSEPDTILNWELKTEQATGQSGLFYGAATRGTYNNGATESISGFAGLRGIATPIEDFRLAAEITPHAALNDLSSPNASLSLNPKVMATSDLGQLGESDFVGSFAANAGYNLPLDGDPSAYGGFRFTVRPTYRQRYEFMVHSWSAISAERYGFEINAISPSGVPDFSRAETG